MQSRVKSKAATKVKGWWKETMWPRREAGSGPLLTRTDLLGIYGTIQKPHNSPSFAL